MTFRAMNRAAAAVCLFFCVGVVVMASWVPGKIAETPSPAYASLSPLSSDR